MLSREKGEQTVEKSAADSAPKLAKRSLHRKSTIMSGRTIGAKRERLETANERALARKKDKQKSAVRFLSATSCFIIIVAIFVALYSSFINQEEGTTAPDSTSTITEPTITIVDEDSVVTQATNRMREFVARAEECFKEKGYQPEKAVIPSTGIREVRIYLNGYEGFIKMIVDRDPAVSVEDADRMLRYLAEQGVSDFRYIDVRIDRKAYWK